MRFPHFQATLATIATAVSMNPSTFAQAIPDCTTVVAETLYDGASLSPVSIAEATSRLSPASVVIVSENHGVAAHHDKQVAFFRGLLGEGRAVLSIGMEFFEFPEQHDVDLYMQDRITEADFLTRIAWGQPPFSFYRRQVLMPRESGGTTLALNAPRALTSRIARIGLDALTPEERRLIPDDFQLGNAAYLARFRATMAGHATEEQLTRYFQAQSVWDDTMAFHAATFLQSHPDHVLGIIVGDFHATYGGGLPDRLRARGVEDVVVVSQVNIHGLTRAEACGEVVPSSVYGPRADYVWVSDVGPGR